MKQTHTFSVLEVSESAYQEIADAFIAVGYDHAFVDGVIDMSGVGVVERVAEPQKIELEIGMSTVPCFKCGAPLQNLFDSGNQPSKALAFTSGGHYGTTAFDPMDGTFLEINICDSCIQAAAKEGHVLRGSRSPITYAQTEYQRWDGE